jgi:hypothetical protein
MPRGGHFAALEQPALLAQDIRVFLRPLRSMHARIPVAVQPKNSDAEGSQLLPSWKVLSRGGLCRNLTLRRKNVPWDRSGGRPLTSSLVKSRR